MRKIANKVAGPGKEKHLGDRPHLPEEHYALPQELVDKFVEQLTEPGIEVIKHGRTGKCSKRLVKLEPESFCLVYSPSHKKPQKARIELADVWEIRPGYNTRVFTRSGKPGREQFSLSLVLKSGETTDIEVSDVRSRAVWIQGLTYLVRRAIHHAENDIKLILRKLWIEADVDGDNALTFAEIERLLYRLNLTTSRKRAQELFHKVDKDRSGAVDFDEFVHLYEELTAPCREMEKLFYKYCSQGSQVMTLTDFKAFVEREQLAEDWTDPDLQCALEFCMSLEKTIDLRQFSLLLTKSANTWWNPVHLRTVYHDMDQPLNHYFVASSHNTYLSGDQLRSDSKVEMYETALKRGCRCVELDCWDGDDGEPIVYHGHTATSKILFEDVVKGIHRAAFLTSEFPVILSLEVHTNLEQQARMAHHMRRIFRDRLAEPIAYTSVEPSEVTPNLYRKKIMVKAKMLPRSEAEAEEKEGESDDDEEEGDGGNAKKEASKSKHKPGKARIAKALSDCVFLKSVHIKSMQVSINEGKVWEICSHSETKVEKLIKDNMAAFVEVNKVMWSRTYPKGTRISSDNYDPHPAWSAGCQLVALNYQTMDYPMRINEAKFRQNAKCGYLLKPPYLRDRGIKEPPSAVGSGAPWALKVRVICGCELPRPALSKQGEIVDPFVRLIITGTEVENGTAVRATESVQDNGWNPVWDHEEVFELRGVELAMLTLRVLDEDMGKDDTLAEASIPIESIRQGYRSVPLHNILNDVPISGSCLFCHFELIPPPPPPPPPQPQPQPASANTALLASASMYQLSPGASSSSPASLGVKSMSVVGRLPQSPESVRREKEKEKEKERERERAETEDTNGTVPASPRRSENQ